VRYKKESTAILAKLQSTVDTIETKLHAIETKVHTVEAVVENYQPVWDKAGKSSP